MVKFHRDIDLEKTKIIRLLRTFSKKELHDLDNFLKFHFSTKYIELKIFEYLYSFAPKFKPADRALYIDAMYNFVYKKEMTKETKIINLQNSISDLYSYIMRYLTWMETKTFSFESEVIKLKALKKRNLKNDYLGHIKRISNRIEKKKQKEFWDPLHLLQLKDMYYYSTEIEKLDNNSNVVLEAMNQLDHFFAVAKLKYSCELLSRKNLLQEQHDINLLEETQELIQKNKWNNNKLISLYSKALNLITNAEEINFEVLKKEISQNPPIEKRELFIFWLYLFNYTAKLIRQGDTSKIKQSFNLYKIGLKQNIFTVDGYFPEILFVNVINFGCTLGVHRELTQFINTWGNTLKPKVKDHTLSLAYARIHFEKNKFEDALKFCKDLKHKNDSFDLQSKMIEIRSYFELREKYKKKIYKKCEQFEKYLKGHKRLHQSIIKGGLNFLIIYRSLLNPKNKKAMIKRTTTLKPIIAKEWLLSKINQID